jgi:NAD(P)-dependent dehydrogenase (short-subunit alcohol dehydrogenase family)/uncharacterized OB-fold protein
MSIPPPKRKNPLARTRQPLLPPVPRSRAALGLGAAASWGRFALQVCAACEHVQYPPREVCGACLSGVLLWRDVPPGGTVIAATNVRISADPYFRERAPWRIGTVTMDAGPAVIAHLHDGVAVCDRVRLVLRLDKAGQGVMLALPQNGRADERDGKAMREMTADPRDRRVLVSDGRHPVGQAVARALIEAGAKVVVGIAGPWRPFTPIPGADVFELDVTDTDSVRRATAEFGGRIEIVVNTALHIRPGGIIGRGDVITARDEMEITYFGFMRLAQAFGPALRFRGADGTHPACAWVNVLSVFGLAGSPAWGGLSAAHAAALSLAQTLRAELRPGGIRVVNALVGPLDDEWHQSVPPPKVAPAAIGAALVRALREGVEQVAVGDVAQDIVARWRDDPDVLAREMMEGMT